MKKLGIALGLGMLTVVFFGFQSTATAADDYPDDTILHTHTNITLSASSLVGGKTLHISAEASGDGDPSGTLTVSFLGKTYSDSGDELSVSVETPKVDSATTKTVRATFTPDETVESAAGDNAIVAAPLGAIAVPAAVFYSPSSDSANVTLLPEGGSVDSSGGLPDTGANGNLLTFLLLGGGLVAIGAAGVYVGKRRGTF